MNPAPAITSALTSVGRDHRGEPVLDGLRDAHVEQGQLEPGADPGEEVEPRAADLGAALHVDRGERLPEGQVVLRLEVELRHRPDRLEHGVVVLATDRHAVLDDVADLADQVAEQHLRRVGVGLQRLDPRRQLLGLREQGLLLLALGLRDLLAHRLLLGAQLLELGQRGTVRLLGGEDRVDDPLVLTAGALAGADAVRVLTQELDVDHRASLPRVSTPLTTPRYAAWPAPQVRCPARFWVSPQPTERIARHNAFMLTRRHLLLLAPLGAVAACAGDPATGSQPSATSPPRELDHHPVTRVTTTTTVTRRP